MNWQNNLNSFTGWAREKFDATLVLAIATETPRWTVVFITLHEPAWIGVTMGVLISWAAKKGWNAWTHNKERWGLFFLNVWVLVSAVLIMAPVLYEMTQHQIHDVNVAQSLIEFSDNALWVWTILVAQSTFMPLIQAVVAMNHEPVALPLHVIDLDLTQPKKQITQHDETETKPIAQQKTTAQQRRAQLDEWVRNNVTINVPDVAQLFGVSKQLIRRELKELRS